MLFCRVDGGKKVECAGEIINTPLPKGFFDNFRQFNNAIDLQYV